MSQDHLAPEPKVTVVQVEGVVIRPGDHLVIRVDPRTSAHAVAELRKRIEEARERLPGLGPAVIFAVDELLVYRPEEVSGA